MAPSPSIQIERTTFTWDVDAGDFTTFGHSCVLFWANPSLFRMLAPLVDEIGADLFRLLVAQSSALGTGDDYAKMVTVLGDTFEKGFLAWGRAVSTAGWGAFELPRFDPASGTAVVRVRNAWELRMQRAGGASWGCPFLQGKIIGIFNHALGQGCWADEEINMESEQPEVSFSLYPSERTIDAELDLLRRERAFAAQAALAEKVEIAKLELVEKGIQIEQKDRLIRSLSTPILHVWDGVLVVPLVGELSAERAEQLNVELLSSVVRQRAAQVLLDLTGLSAVDSAVVDRLGSTIAALRLLGTECAVVGLSPELARTIVELGVSLAGVKVLRTLADALRDVVGLSKAERRRR